MQPEWRNWQTRWIQNPVSVTGCVGSSPSSGTEKQAVSERMTRNDAGKPSRVFCHSSVNIGLILGWRWLLGASDGGTSAQGRQLVLHVSVLGQSPHVHDRAGSRRYRRGDGS